MKIRFTWLLILLAFACSKDDDAAAPAAATGGCTVNLKGTVYTFTAAICIDAISGSTIDGLTANGSTAAMSFIIARDTSDPSSNSLTLALTGGTVVYVAADGITSQPTINRTGKTWSFNGTATNGTDSGTISGNCTCTN